MEYIKMMTNRLWAVLQNVAILLLLCLLLPINCLIVLPSLLWSYINKPFRKRISPKNPKNVLITGGKPTKALQLARSFHAAGHTVFMAEKEKYWFSGNRFSHAVKRFYTVPAAQEDIDSYCQALLDIVKRENIDMFVPVSYVDDSYADSVAKTVLSPFCESFNFGADITQMLDNKFTFCQKAKELGLSAPKVFLFTKQEEILDFDFASDGSQYVLKSVAYDRVHRLDLTTLPMATKEEMIAFVEQLPISESNPWLMQEFIVGQEYTTHTTVRNGTISLHCCTHSSPVQINYEHINHPKIYRWTVAFIEGLNLQNGQISFDFIEKADGSLYPVECNPRTHTAVTAFHDHPGLADAYLHDGQFEDKVPIEPLPNSRPTYWIYHELWRLTGIRSWAQFQKWVHTVTTGTDAIYQVNDPLPFLMVHHWDIPLLLLEQLRKCKRWKMININIGVVA